MKPDDPAVPPDVATRLAWATRIRRVAQNGAPTHEIERPGRWKKGGGMVDRYTHSESAGLSLWCLQILQYPTG